MKINIILLLLLPLSGWSQSSKDSLRKHVIQLSEQPYPRNTGNLKYLNKAADYIHHNFRVYTDKVFFQHYEIEKLVYKNVIASFGPVDGPRIVVGAHYDVWGDTPGADANASAVAAILELARLCSSVGTQLRYRIDLVTYSTEEGRKLKEHCGSYMHAKSLKDYGVEVLIVLNLQGIGFFTDVPHSQKYPIFYYKYLYGHRANFISLYLQTRAGYYPNQFKRLMKQYAMGIRVLIFKPIIPLDKLSLGSHNNYWQMGYPTIKISNTNSFRNKYYRKDVDTYETLDYNRMSAVTDMIYQAITRFKK